MNLKTELRRKVFHLLTLIYFGAFTLLGADISLILIGTFVAFELVVEIVRLKSPAVNALLIGYFQGIHRPFEERKISGVFWTALGSFSTIALFKEDPKVVQTALLYLSLGDAAAALAGKSIGGPKWPGSDKTYAGSAGCFAVCWACGALTGLPGEAALIGAAAAALIELLPLPLNDNFWLPVGSAAVLRVSLKLVK